MNADVARLVLVPDGGSGVANAADTGLDIWANFGAAIQVKHITLTPELLEDITESVDADRIIVVALDDEKAQITGLLKQVNYINRVQAIITLTEISGWYATSMKQDHRDTLGQRLLQDLATEFGHEFPSITNLAPFLKERGYDEMTFSDPWTI